MLSLEKCKELLNRDGKSYSDEQILKIRTFLYQLAEIEYEEYIKNLKNEEESDHLHTGVYRRAS